MVEKSDPEPETNGNFLSVFSSARAFSTITLSGFTLPVFSCP
ncbi:MAG: hypothetical protein WCB90_11365 [Methanosarcina sp.]